MSDTKTNGSSPPATLTAEQAERIITLASQTLIEIRRMARMQSAGQQLDARRQMAWSDVMDRVERAMRRVQSPALTVVQDVAMVEATGVRGDEVSVVNLRLPWKRALVPVPNRYLRIALSWLIGGASGGGLIHMLHQWGVFHR